MTPLRQRMITAMQMHGYSPRTHQSYLAAVRGLAKYTHRSPDSLNREDLRGYFEYLVTERHLAPASVRLSYNGIRFFYLAGTRLAHARPGNGAAQAGTTHPGVARAPRSRPLWTPAPTNAIAAC